MNTPRTDAEEKYTVRIAMIAHMEPDYVTCVSEAFARQLERELNDALLEVERLKRDVAKAVWEDNGMMRYWPSMYGKLKELGITFNILNRKPKAAMVEGGQE